MLTVHHLSKSQSERIVWLCEELGVSTHQLSGMRVTRSRFWPRSEPTAPFTQWLRAAVKVWSVLASGQALGALNSYPVGRRDRPRCLMHGGQAAEGWDPTGLVDLNRQSGRPVGKQDFVYMRAKTSIVVLPARRLTWRYCNVEAGREAA